MDLKMGVWLPYLCTSRTEETPTAEGVETRMQNVFFFIYCITIKTEIIMIKVKARETMINVGKYAGTYRYVMSPELYNTLNEQTVISEAALRCGMNVNQIETAYKGIADVLKVWATNGHCVPIPGLGNMRFGLRAESVDEVKKVKTELITTRRVIFIPAVSIKEVLAKTPIQITCYDRYGKIKKTVSEDEGKVEDDSTTYTLTVEASPAEGGTVEGSGTYSPGQMVEISAVAKSGYRFSAWNDGDTDANRTVTVTGDATYTATFVSTATGDDGDDDGGLAG